MAKWKGITADELIVLRKIERINYQLRAIAKEFGTNSRLYRHYENFLTSTKKNTLADGGLIRETKSGAVLQLRADKAAVRDYQYTAYLKALNRLGKFQTVGERKQQMLRAYSKRTKADLDKMNRSERRAAYKEEKQYEKNVYEVINDTLFRYYKLEDDIGNGKEFASHDDLRRLSKGIYTDAKDLEEIIRIANAELEAEEHIIKDEYDDYLAGL